MTSGGITLREYVETLVQVHARETATAFESHKREHILIQQALSKAEESMNRRLEGMNEFRAQLDKQQITFATREYVQSMLDPIHKFQERFWGVLIGITLLNVMLTTLIVLLIRAWAGER